MRIWGMTVAIVIDNDKQNTLQNKFRIVSYLPTPLVFVHYQSGYHYIHVKYSSDILCE